MERPATIAEVQEAVRAAVLVRPQGGGTKPALSAASDAVAALDLSCLSGMVEYEPAEFTFTALAGTPVAEVARQLVAEGQYLPCDPPLVSRGATLGGTVAAGLSGPGRYRYGGLRDFILGVRYVDGAGSLIRGGGKVVKNAAGFDLPKLMIGSLGMFGVLVELTFKVFPMPESYLTVRREYSSLDAALDGVRRLGSAPLDLYGLELEPVQDGAILWIRLGGLPGALPHRRERSLELLDGGDTAGDGQEPDFWDAARDFGWVPEGWSLVKVPLTPGRVPALESALQHLELAQAPLRRYSAGCQMAWVAMSAEAAVLDDLLADLGLAGLVLFGSSAKPRLGVRPGAAFEKRIKSALDPIGRFWEV